MPRKLAKVNNIKGTMDITYTCSFCDTENEITVSDIKKVHDECWDCEKSVTVDVKRYVCGNNKS